VSRPFPTQPPDVDFTYPLLACSDFDLLLSGAGDPASPDAVLSMAERHGRLLIQAKAGFGKSTTLLRLKQQAKERGIAAHVVSLGDSTIDLSGDDRSFRLAEALDPPLPPDDLDGDRAFVFVDGLNEIERAQQSALIDAVDELARSHPSVGIVVTDRLTRRSLRVSRWALVGIGPVPPERIAELLPGQDSPLFGSPAYLDYAMRGQITTASRSSMHEQVLTEDGFGPCLDTLAAFALSRYQTASSRLFPTAAAREVLGRELLEDAIKAGLIHEVEVDTSRFRHHLIHDYLAARAAAALPASWSAPLFEQLTFRASSFDVLVMLMEQADPSHVDLLLRKVYDYNLYAAAYLLGEDAAGARRATPATEAEILIMLGERRFERMLVTAQQATDALTLHGSALAAQLLMAREPSEVHALAASQLAGDADYQTWLSLYLGSGSAQGLTEADGVVGWTTANVLRRNLTPDQAEGAAVLTGHNDPVVRWRAVHVLGAADPAHSPAHTGLLFHLFETDDAHTVRYGALRSLVEHALRAESREVRLEVFTGLANQVDVLLSWTGLQDEFERVLKVSSPPDDWDEAAAVTVEKLMASVGTEREQDRWRRLSAQLRLGWGVLE
jgi:hypothetical protein